MCPQQRRRMLNSLLLTSLSVNSSNPVIDQFSMPLAHRPSAYEELRSKFVFLCGKFDILSPDEIERLAEKFVTLYQDDMEQRFSNELLQFVDYSNEFLDYAEDVLWHFLYKLTIDKRIKCSFRNVEIAQRTNLILMAINCSRKRSFSKLKYIDLIADFARRKRRNMPGL